MLIEITDEYLYNIMPKVAALIMTDIPENPKMPFEPSPEFDKRMKKLIRKSKQPGWLKFMNRKLSHVACLAIIVITIAVALSVSVLANESLIIKLKEQFILEDGIIEYFHVTGEDNIKFPTYMPEEYELISEDADPYYAEYQNDIGRRIIFEAWEIEDGSMVFRDTEFVSEKSYTINDNEISFGYKENGALKVSWYDGNILYLLHIDNLPEDEVVTIVESMK